MRRFTTPFLLAAALMLPALAQADDQHPGDTAKDAAHDTANSAKQTGHDAANTAKDAARDTSSAAKETAKDAKDTAKSATADASKLSTADKDFMTEAAQGGMAEVKLGELAKSKAQSSAVKTFADKMVTDHSKANDELKSLAAKKDVTLPADVNSEDQKKYDELSKLSGADFDKAYMDEMVKDHDKDVSLFQKQAKSAKDKDVRSFAAKTLPTLKSHKQMAHANMNSSKHM